MNAHHVPEQPFYCRRVGRRPGPALRITEALRLALETAKGQHGTEWVLRRIPMDRSVLDKIIAGTVKTSAQVPLMRQVLRVVDEDSPLDDEERELVRVFRLAKQALPEEARKILEDARVTAEECVKIADELN